MQYETPEWATDDAARLREVVEREELTDKTMAEICFAYEGWTLREWLRWMTGHKDSTPRSSRHCIAPADFPEEQGT